MRNTEPEMKQHLMQRGFCAREGAKIDSHGCSACTVEEILSEQENLTQKMTTLGRSSGAFFHIKNLLLGAFVVVASTLSSSEHASQVAEVASPQAIHVLLQEDTTEALLEVKGPYFLFNPHDGSKICSGVLGKRFMVHSLPNGLKWGEEFPGIHQFIIVPRGEGSSVFVNGIQYSGSVCVYSVGNRINIVNQIDVENYVKSVLASQFSAPLESEVMAALAILLRTNSYYALSRQSNVFWNVLAKESGYQGVALCSPGSPIDRAVDATRHLILVHSSEGRSLPFAATWTEHCAGKTADYKTMFRKEAFSPFPSVDAPHASLDRKGSKWTCSISKKSLAGMLDLREIKDLELFIDHNSNKVYGARVKDSKETSDFDFFALQERLGKQRIQSSDFTVSVKDDSIMFTGYGKGHGVGLCLYSASAMAQNGDNAIKILSKFFPDSYIMNLNGFPGHKGNIKLK